MTEKDVKRVGTLTKDEWEAAGLYLAFAFEKVDSGEKKGDLFYYAFNSLHPTHTPFSPIIEQ